MSEDVLKFDWRCKHGNRHPNPDAPCNCLTERLLTAEARVKELEVFTATDKKLNEILIAENARLREALHFYGYEAIHNPEAKSKSEQYWNDAGIWDHGERARKALAHTSREKC